jgi:anti-anti-sigma factor
VRPVSDAGFSVVSHPGSPDHIVQASGEIDINACETLRHVLLDALALHPARIVVDMAEVTFIDSSGISVLVAAHKRGELTGTAVVLQSPGRQVVRVLEITGLDSVLTLLRDPPSAER